MTDTSTDAVKLLADYLDGSGDYEGGIVEDRREEAADTIRAMLAERDAVLEAARAAGYVQGLTDARSAIAYLPPNNRMNGRDDAYRAIESLLFAKTSRIIGAGIARIIGKR